MSDTNETVVVDADMIAARMAALRLDLDKTMCSRVDSAAKNRDRGIASLPELKADLMRVMEAGLLTPAMFKAMSTYDLELSYRKVEFRIEASDLPKWRKIGKLTATSKAFHDTKPDGTDLLLVTVAVEGLGRCVLEYVREVPKSETARCKVVEVPSTYKTLVCSR